MSNINLKDIFVQKAIKLHGNLYDYSKINYVNSKQPIEIICSKHGSFWQIPNDHLRGCGCKKCSGVSKLTTSEFIQKAQLKHGNKYDYSKVIYKHSHEKVEIICYKHGSFWQEPRNHINGSNCLKCNQEMSSNLQMKDNNLFISESVKIHGDKYDYTNVEYNGAFNKIEIICHKHGSFWQTPNCHSKGGCIQCAIDNNTLTTSEFIEKAIVVHGNRYDYSKVNYVNSHTKVEIICNKHGSFFQNSTVHLMNHNCPKCSTIISKPHQKIIELLPPNIEIINNDRTFFKGHEIDILLLEVKIGIEIHGVYWHGLKNNNFEDHNRYKNVHHQKASLAQKADIKLFQFWDFEIDQKPELIKSMINNSIGISNKVYARKCTIVQLNNSISKKFFNKSHLQGHRNASIIYGLMIHDEIQCVVSFSRHSNYEWEIIRYACKLDTNVIGGFSRLLKHFIKENNPKQILTFADRRISTGNLYLKTGFKQISITKPNYFYWKKNVILSRQQCQKHKLHKLLGDSFRLELSETENMLLNGFSKIYDAGHVKLIMEL